MKRYVILAALLSTTLLAVQLAGTPKIAPDSHLPVTLPDKIGTWEGSDVLYCRNVDCDNSTTAVLDLGATNNAVCPACDGELVSISAVERNILPPDTVILRKQYRHPSEGTISVTVVLTGTQRASIHRAEWCLPAQGYRITAKRRLSVPVRDGRLPITLLDIARQRSSADGTVTTATASYAYWFQSNGRTVGTHLGRLAFMAMDNIVRGVTHRWASVSVMAGRQPGSDSHVEQIERFLVDFYPALTAGPAQQSPTGNPGP